MLKRIAQTLLVILTLLLVAGTVAYFLAKKYEPEVRDIVVYEVNRLLDVEVKVEDINLSLMQRFPYASLRLSHVVVPEAYCEGRQCDTLLYVKDLYLQISLWDFLRKQYRISEADLNSGFFHMEFFPKGKDNYHFWKSAESADPAVISLQNIAFNDFRFRYREAGGPATELLIREATARGSFGTEVYEVGSHCTVDLHYFSTDGDTLYTNLPIRGELAFQINNLSKRHELSAPLIQLGRQKLGVRGHYDPEHHHAWEIRMEAQAAQIDHIIELLPRGMRHSLRAYKAKGKTDIVLEAKDANNKPLHLDLLFDRAKGSFQHDVALGKAEIQEGAGSLQVRGALVSLYIDKLQGSLGPGRLSLAGSVRNFSLPEINLRISGSLDLQEVRNFFNIDYLDVLKGKVAMEGTLQGKLRYDTESAKAATLKGISFDGKIDVKDGGLKPREASAHFEAINGELRLDDNAISVQDGRAKVNGSDFRFSGKLSNALPYLLLDGQRLYIAADLAAPSLDFNTLWNTSESRRDTSYRFSLPEMVSFDVQLELGEATFRRFVARNISGRAVYSKELLTLNPIRFQLASGQAEGRASVARKTHKSYQVDAGLALQQMDVSQLFYAFEDFGQSMVSSRQISGRADASVKFKALLSEGLELDAASIQSMVELEVVKGKLQKVEALAEVADYLRGNMVWRSLVKVDAFEKKLASIDFDTLRNTIDIRDRVVYIPAMRVGSSALTLQLSGKHDFDNRIDYRLNFRLSELFRTGKPRTEEFGYLVDDQTGLRLFLQMTGNVDDPIFSMDKEGARQKRKDDFSREKSTVKGIFKQEFGLFKGDSSAVVPSAPVEKGPQFKVEWDEFEKRNEDLQKQNPTAPSQTPPTRRTKPKKPVDDPGDDDDL